MFITPHQKKRCHKCYIDASVFRHCAFCGEDFDSLEKLADHMDECEWYPIVVAHTLMEA